MESRVNQTPISLDKLQRIHLHAHDWQQESLTFVPLRGTWFAQSEHSFVLEEEINKFLSSDKKVLLLLGDSGSGKSLYTQGLTSKLWSDHKPDTPIPVWISLPSLKDPVNKAIEETFEKFGFNAEQVEALKQKNTFIFIFDAFDEIHQLKNLWVSNHLDQWKAKIIITCRREYLYHVDNYKLYFTPFNGEKAVYQDYDEIIIKPFSEEQIEQYIKQYIQHQKPEWLLEQYQKAIEEIPGLKNLIKTPFLLKLAMEALPKIPQDKEQKYMTQAKLYDVFIEQWFIRQEQKLKLAKKITEDEDVKSEFWDYAKKLAQLMHQQKTTLVTYDSSQISDLFGEIEDNPWQKFFNPDNPRIELLRTACLVREVGTHQYAFVHNSLLEYFMTRDLYENLLSQQEEVKITQEVLKSPQLEVKKQQDYFNERLLVQESNTLQFLADRVDEDEAFKKTLFDCVYASKKNPQASTQASNALTILNCAQVPFAGMDLSDIFAPHADLTGAIFSGASLRRADLYEAILSRAFLGDADFTNANLEKSDFGEYPALYSDVLYCVSYSSDGLYMAFSDGNEIILYAKKQDHYEKLTQWQAHKRTVESIAFSPDGRTLASGGSDETVRCWDLSTRTFICEFKGHKDVVTSVEFNPVGKILVSGSGDRTLRLWDLSTQSLLVELKGHTSWIENVAFSPDGKLVASASWDRTVCLWDSENHQLLKQLKGHRAEAKCIAFSPDNRMLASGSEDHTICLWDIVTHRLLTQFKAHTDAVSSLVFSADGSVLASGSNDKTVRLWDVQTYSPLAEFKGHADHIKRIMFSPDGKTLASGDGKTVRFWKIPIELTKAVWKGHTDQVNYVIFSPDGRTLASASQDSTVCLWDIVTKCLLAEFKTHKKRVNSLSFSPNGRILASASLDQTVCLWDAKTKRLLVQFKKHVKSVTSVVFSPDGKILASAGGDEVVYLWDVPNQDFLGELKGHTDWVHSVAFSPDGKILASGSRDNTLRLWDIFSKRIVKELKGHGDSVSGVCSVAFSPDGKTFATLGERLGGRNYLCLWDTSTWQLIKKLKDDSTDQVVFSPDGKTLASGGRDNTVRLWNIINQRLVGVLKLKGHADFISSVAFSPDGKYLASGSHDISIFIWEKISSQSLEKEEWLLVHRFENTHTLVVSGALFEETKISDLNFNLLEQRGAISIGEQKSEKYKPVSKTELSEKKSLTDVSDSTSSLDISQTESMDDKESTHSEVEQEKKLDPTKCEEKLGSLEEIFSISDNCNLEESRSSSFHNPHAFFQVTKDREVAPQDQDKMKSIKQQDQDKQAETSVCKCCVIL